MKVIAVSNQKGGTGKTTSTVNIGAGLAAMGKKVLLVDLDPQAHLTAGLGIQPDEAGPTVNELLRGQAEINDTIRERGGFSLIPSSLDLSGADLELGGLPGREMLLKHAIGRLNDYDLVLIDCPPSLGLLALNAFTAAQEVYVALQTEFYALYGMNKLADTIRLVRERLDHPNLEITGVIATIYDGRKNLHKQVVERIREHFGGKLFETIIRTNVALAEAPSHGLTIFEHAPESNGAKDYAALSQEIIGRAGL